MNAPRSRKVDPLNQLRQRKYEAGHGDAEAFNRQHAKGKLTARERIDLLVDRGTFVELGVHGRPHFSQKAMEGREAPADGVVTGWGEVNGRRCGCPSNSVTCRTMFHSCRICTGADPNRSRHTGPHP